MELPEGFTTKKVEGTILPIDKNYCISERRKEIVLERIKNPQTPVEVFEIATQLEVENLKKLEYTIRLKS